MECAPILIPTLNRHVHFIRLIESLKRNAWARYTPVYVALDYPPSDKYMDGYRKICEYLKGDFGEFLEFNVVRRDHNYGSYQNMAALREMVFEKYDRFIRTDDDAEFSPNFLEYMNKCLKAYEFDEDVIAVCGYSYPLKWNVDQESNILKESFICPMWGTGFWKTKYAKLEQYISNDSGLARDARTIIKSGGYKRMTDICCSEFVDLCFSPDFKITLAATLSDISLRMYMAVYNKYVIMPRTSKVRNWGFDGTGQFCTIATGSTGVCDARHYSYHLQPIDNMLNFTLKPDRLGDNSFNKSLMNTFDGVSIIVKIRVCFKIIIYRVVGECIYHKLTLVFRKIKKYNFTCDN